MNFVEHIRQAFEKAERKESKLISEIFDIEGMSGEKTRHLYNNLVNFDGAKYLEIGTWQGSTVSAAMYGNKAEIVCIDNFSQFTDKNPKERLLNNIQKYKGENNVTFLEQDCFTVDTTKLPKFNMYMYDGNHSSEDQCRALKYYYDCLEETFIYIVDDWNWPSVKDGTKKAIEELNLKIIDKIEVFTVKDGDQDGYWNGVFLCILQKS